MNAPLEPMIEHFWRVPIQGGQYWTSRFSKCTRALARRRRRWWRRPLRVMHLLSDERVVPFFDELIYTHVHVHVHVHVHICTYAYAYAYTYEREPDKEGSLYIRA